MVRNEKIIINLFIAKPVQFMYPIIDSYFLYLSNHSVTKIPPGNFKFILPNVKWDDEGFTPLVSACYDLLHDQIPTVQTQTTPFVMSDNLSKPLEV